MEEGLISVVVPIYKVEKYLAKCIDSIIEQSYRNIELILVDDGSPDSCPQICEEYRKKDSRIKVIHKQNGGLSDARNAGMEIATGEWITFIDSDDYVGINFLKELYSSAINTKADISICDYKSVSDDTGQEIKKTSTEEFDNVKCLEEMYHPRTHGMEFVAWGKLYQTKLFKKNGIEYPVGKIHEDTFTTYKLIYAAKRIAFCNAIEYFYRQREASIMTSSFNINRLVMLNATREACEYFIQQQEKELFDMAVNAHFRTNILMYLEMYKNKQSIKNCKMEKDALIYQYRKDIKKYLNKTNIKTKNKIFYILFYYTHMSCLGFFLNNKGRKNG